MSANGHAGCASSLKAPHLSSTRADCASRLHMGFRCLSDLQLLVEVPAVYDPQWLDFPYRLCTFYYISQDLARRKQLPSLPSTLNFNLLPPCIFVQYL